MKKVLMTSGIIAVFLSVAAFVFREKIYRIHFALKMFSGVEQVERFRSVEKYFPTKIILPAKTPSRLFEHHSFTLPATYQYEGKMMLL